MSNSVDPDETAYYGPSHPDLCCLQKPIIIACGSERANLACHTLYCCPLCFFFVCLLVFLFLCITFSYSHANIEGNFFNFCHSLLVSVFLYFISYS